MSYSIDDRLFINARTASVSLDGNLEVKNYISFTADGESTSIVTSMVPYTYVLVNSNITNGFLNSSLRTPTEVYSGSNIFIPYVEGGVVKAKRAVLTGVSNISLESAASRVFNFSDTFKTHYDPVSDYFINIASNALYINSDRYAFSAPMTYAFKDFIYFNTCNIMCAGYYREDSSTIVLTSNNTPIASNIFPVTNFQYNYFLLHLDGFNRRVNWSKIVEGFQNTDVNLLDIKLVSCCRGNPSINSPSTFACYINTENSPVRIVNGLGELEGSVLGTSFNNSREVVVGKFQGSNIAYTTRIVPDVLSFSSQRLLEFSFHQTSDISLYLKNTSPTTYRIYNPDNSLFTTNDFTSLLVRYDTHLQRRWQAHIDSSHDTILNPLQPLRSNELLLYTTNPTSENVYVYNSDESIYETIPMDSSYAKMNAYIIYDNGGNVTNVSYSKYPNNSNVYYMSKITQDHFIKLYKNYAPSYQYNDPYDTVTVNPLIVNNTYLDSYIYQPAAPFKLVRIGENIDTLIIASDKLTVQGKLQSTADSLSVSSGFGNSNITVTNAGLVTLAQQSIASSGKSILLIATGVLQPNTGTTDAITLQFYRGTTAIGKAYPNTPNANTTSYHAFAMHFIDRPAAGNYVYTLRAIATTGSMKIGYVNTEPAFTVMELI